MEPPRFLMIFTVLWNLVLMNPEGHRLIMRIQMRFQNWWYGIWQKIFGPPIKERWHERLKLMIALSFDNGIDSGEDFFFPMFDIFLTQIFLILPGLVYKLER